MTETARSMIEKLNEKMGSNPDIAEKINTVFQFVIQGDDGGEWWFDFTTTPPQTGEGINDGAACTITVNADDFVAMINKDTNPVKLFMSGKLKIGGDLSQAMKLQGLLG